MGVAIAIFNQVSRIAIFPLVSVTTSFVAEEDTTMSLTSKDCARLENGRDSEGLVNGEHHKLIPQRGTLPNPICCKNINFCDFFLFTSEVWCSVGFK